MEPQSKVFTYKKSDQFELAIEVFYPPDWKPTDHRAGIIFFFGGGWVIGERIQFYPQCKYLASRGMVAATADYRTGGKHHTTPSAAVEDARSAIRWMRVHAKELGLDADRIVASGGSAGGNLAACAALCPGLDNKDNDLSISCKPQALVLYNPVLNMAGAAWYLQRIYSGFENTRKTMEMMSPNLHITKDAPPTILFFGSGDPLRAWGIEYQRLASERAARAELYLANGQSHAFFNKSPWVESTLYQADLFLISLGYLQGKPTIPVDPGARLQKYEPPASQPAAR